MSKSFNDFNKKPKSLRVLDTLQVIVIIAFITVVGAYYQSLSKAATNVSGRVTINGNGVNDIYIDGCGFNLPGYAVAAITNSQGYFTFSTQVGVDQGYCVRVFSAEYLPASDARVAHNAPKFFGLNGPKTVQNPGVSGPRYEYQVFGKACYNNTTDPICRAGYERKYDRSSDTNFTFAYSSPPTPTPTPTPTPVPTPTPSPTPTPTPITIPKSQPSYSGSLPGGNNTAYQPVADTTPPSAPTEFVATKNDEHKSVLLQWQASTDDIGVGGYRIERSKNQQDWQAIAEAVTDTSYEDLTPSFGDTNYYRILAFDAAGNRSNFVTASVVTSNFEANAFAGKESKVTSDDKIVEIVIPAGAVKNDVYCNIGVALTILGPNVANYRQVGGPYELNCRDSSGNTVTAFSDVVLVANVSIGKLNSGKRIKLAYFGQKDRDWQELKILKSDRKTRVDTVELGTHTVFSILSPNKKTSIWGIILKILMVLLGIGLALLLALRFRLRQKLQHQYDDYMRQSRGL